MDLAGSERLNKSNATGQQLKEVRCILVLCNKFYMERWELENKYDIHILI